jgi:predicted branched-subunit amino acid permease
MRDMLPAFPGIFAWGLVTGVAMVKGGLGVPLALVTTFLAYAGSAQLASLPLIAAAAPVWVIGVTALVTNMRFVIYAAAMRTWLTEYSLRRRAVLGFFTADMSFAFFMGRVAREGAFAHRDAFIMGMDAMNWIAWQLASVIGIVAASFIPSEWGLQFAGTLALLALVVPLCKERAMAAGAVTAGLVALVGRRLPLGLGLLAGAMAGIVVATLVDDSSAGKADATG